MKKINSIHSIRSFNLKSKQAQDLLVRIRPRSISSKPNRNHRSRNQMLAR